MEGDQFKMLLGCNMTPPPLQLSAKEYGIQLLGSCVDCLDWRIWSIGALETSSAFGNLQECRPIGKLNEPIYAKLDCDDLGLIYTSHLTLLESIIQLIRLKCDLNSSIALYVALNSTRINYTIDSTQMRLKFVNRFIRRTWLNSNQLHGWFQQGCLSRGINGNERSLPSAKVKSEDKVCPFE